jgi:hypothetical protein
MSNMRQRRVAECEVIEAVELNSNLTELDQNT